MRSGCVCFLAGVLALCSLQALPAPGWLVLAPLCLGILSPRRALALPAWVLAGFLFSAWRADLILADSLARDAEGRGMVITGRIDSLPESLPGALRFNLRLTDPADSGLDAGTRVRLSWYRDAPDIRAGEIWQLRVRLRRPAGYMNAGAFDFERWLFQRRVRATGYVLAGPGNERRQEPVGWTLDALRDQLRRDIRAGLVDSTTTPLVVALALGDQSGITRTQWEILNRTGVNHLLAISGLHVGLVAAIAWWLVANLWARIPGAAIRCPAPHAAAVAAVTAAGVYALLAGFSVPAQRALVMVATGTLAVVTGPRRLSTVLARAALAVLCWDPFAVLAPGFWLSFLAVAWIGWGTGSRVGRPSAWSRWSAVQWSVSLGLFPVVALWFQRIAPAGLPANMVAVPWVSFITVPLVLAGSLVLEVAPGIGNFLLRGADESLALLWPFLVLLSDWSHAGGSVGPVTLSAVAVAALGSCLLLLPRGMPCRWLGLCLWLPLLAPVSSAPAPGTLQFTLLDVGQGLAAVVRTHRHVLLFDTGPALGPGTDAGASVVVPWLRQAGVDRIDTLVVSHGDADHIGGLGSVRAAVPVQRILSSVPDRIPGGDVAACQDGMQWHWDGFRFSVLHPAAGDGLAGNDASCVLRVQGRGTSLLLTGDIERRAEEELLRRHGSELPAQVLVVPHHGSRTSSTEDFVSAVAPQFALHAAGYRNRFGFPKQDIMQRYRERGALNLDTGRHGALEILVNDAALHVSARRTVARRFWHSSLE